jgi:hypothetical protein
MAALGSSVAWMRSRSTATSMVTVGLRAVRAVLLISISRVGERWRPVRCGRRWGCGRLQWCPGPLVGAAGRIRGKDEERARPAIWWFTVHPLRFASSLCRSGGVQCVGCRKCSCRKVVSAESSYRLALHLHRNLGSCIPPSQRACAFSLRKHLASSCPLKTRLWSALRHRPWPAQCASLHCAERVPAALRLQHTV